MTTTDAPTALDVVTGMAVRVLAVLNVCADLDITPCLMTVYRDEVDVQISNWGGCAQAVEDVNRLADSLGLDEDDGLNTNYTRKGRTVAHGVDLYLHVYCGRA